MLYIRISNRIARETVDLYEKCDCGGHHVTVPTYQAHAYLAENPQMHIRFSVARDASDVVFRVQPDRYGRYGECPPNGSEPFHGCIHAGTRHPFAIRLFDRDCSRRCSLIGAGTSRRSYILIHRSPGRSAGCLLIPGGRDGFATFQASIETLYAYSSDNEIRIWLEPIPAR